MSLRHKDRWKGVQTGVPSWKQIYILSGPSHMEVRGSRSLGFSITPLTLTVVKVCDSLCPFLRRTHWEVQAVEVEPEFCGHQIRSLSLWKTQGKVMCSSGNEKPNKMTSVWRSDFILKGVTSGVTLFSLGRLRRTPHRSLYERLTSFVLYLLQPSTWAQQLFGKGRWGCNSPLHPSTPGVSCVTTSPFTGNIYGSPVPVRAVCYPLYYYRRHPHPPPLPVLLR